MSPVSGAQPAKDKALMRAALQRIVASPEFAQSPRLSRLLSFLVESSISDQPISLKETVIGVEVFGRDPGYDPKIDGVVRTEVRRLRQKLQDYYLGSGSSETIRIALHKGGYHPGFESAAPVEPAPSPHSAIAPSQPVVNRALRGLAAASAVVACLTLAYWLWTNTRSHQPLSPRRQLTTHAGIERTPALSRDGRKSAFSLAVNSGTHIHVVDVATESITPLTSGPERDFEPAWSPDHSKIAFLRASPERLYSIVVVNVADRSEAPLVRVNQYTRLHWSPDGHALAYSDRTGTDGPTSIREILVTEPHSQVQLTTPPVGIEGDTQPAYSFDGRMLAFQRAAGSALHDLYVVPLDSSRMPTAAPKRVTFLQSALNGYAWSADNRSLIVSMQRPRTPRSLWRVPLDKWAPTLISPDSGVWPTTSATGRLVYTLADVDTNVWMLDTTAPGSKPRSLIASTRLDTTPRFSPDGKHIAFRSNRSGLDEVWIADADGNQPRRLTTLESQAGSPRWSPDGKWLVFDSTDAGSSDIMIVSTAGGEPRRFTQEKTNEVTPCWSATGDAVYFSSDRSGVWEVWRQPVAQGRAVQVTSSGGFAPLERDGFLWYSRSRSKPGLYRMPVTGGAEQAVLPDLPGSMWGNWTVRGGRVFYMLESGGIFMKPGINDAPRQLHQLTREPIRWDGGLDVSPDGSALLFVQLDHVGSDLFVMENAARQD